MSRWSLCGLRDSSGLTQNCDEPATVHYAAPGGVAHYCAGHAPAEVSAHWYLLSKEEVLLRQVLDS